MVGRKGLVSYLVIGVVNEHAHEHEDGGGSFCCLFTSIALVVLPSSMYSVRERSSRVLVGNYILGLSLVTYSFCSLVLFH